jgi:virulence-associated protein VapD
MFAIAYDLVVADAQMHHPRGHRQAYLDIASTLRKFGFERVQRSVFASRDEDLARLFSAISELRGLDWFRRSVRNIRAFRVERGADCTTIVKGDTESRGGGVEIM